MAEHVAHGPGRGGRDHLPGLLAVELLQGRDVQGSRRRPGAELGRYRGGKVRQSAIFLPEPGDVGHPGVYALAESEIASLDGKLVLGAGFALSASQPDDFLLYDTLDGSLYYDADANGSEFPKKIAVVQNDGVPVALTHENFAVIRGPGITLSGSDGDDTADGGLIGGASLQANVQLCCCASFVMSTMTGPGRPVLAT